MITGPSQWTEPPREGIGLPAMPSRKSPVTPKKHGLAGRTGRKANASKPAGEKHSVRLVVMVTPGQVERYSAAMKKAGKDQSEWIRDTLDAHAP